MATKSDTFFEDFVDQQIFDAINNDFGKDILRLPKQGHGEVRDEVFIYFSAMAMQQVNALAMKYGIDDPNCLNELYQLTRTNLIHGFRLGQTMRGRWQPS